MKIGLDIDGVILDYERVLRTYGELYNYIELKKGGVINRNEHYLRDRYNWNDEERKSFIKTSFVELSKQTNFIPGAVDVIRMLQNEGHKIVIISARGADMFDFDMEEMIDVAKEKFDKENLEFYKYYWKQEDKLGVCKKEEIDVMIDDSYNTCKNLSENGIKTLYFRDKNMKKIDESDNLKDVSNWGEIYRYIKESK